MTYYNVNKKYLAFSLSYLGFQFYQFTKDSNTIYSFEDTKKFRLALTKITLLKNELNAVSI